MMTEERIDLSPIDLDPDRRAALTAAIAARGQPILARYAAARTPLLVLAAWLRPTLAAAAIVTAVALGILAYTAREGEPATTLSISEALGLPGPWVAWVETGRSPSLEELVVSLEEDSR
jgi:hypothetical protein